MRSLPSYSLSHSLEILQYILIPHPQNDKSALFQNFIAGSIPDLLILFVMNRTVYLNHEVLFVAEEVDDKPVYDLLAPELQIIQASVSDPVPETLFCSSHVSSQLT